MHNKFNVKDIVWSHNQRGVPIGEIGTYRPRAPYAPITVGALAGAAVGPHQIANNTQDSFA